MSAEAIVKKLNQNKIFKFLSSVKLAVPLMLVLSALVGWGTILESHYNAEYSAMYLYKTGWFSCVLILLWINIFCATISRIPFKKHHTGFVITHIGLLTLLIGGFMTNTYGIDGQLSVTEGQSSSTVVLPNLMFGYQLEGSPAPMTVKFTKSISAKNESDLSEVNENLGSFFKVVEYIPFAKVEKVYKTGQKVNDEVALSFMLKSNFFNVNEWLHTQTNPVMQLGPATLKIVKTSNIDEVEKPHMKSKKRVVNSVTPPEPARAPQSTTDQIVISDFSSGKPVKTISLSNLQKKSIEVNGAKISLVKYYRAAVVAANKLEENLDPSANNPALELKVEKGGKSVREILYGKFDQFSLNKDGVFGLKFVFKSSDVAPVAADAQPAAHQSAAVAQTAPKNEAAVAAHAAAGVSAEAAAAEGAPPMQAPDMSQMGTRVIEFKVNPQDPKRVRVTLYKNDEFVATQVLSEGQNFDTPWMGMKVFLGTVQVGAEETSEVVPINPEQRSNLPPAAAKIRLADGTEFWLTEGDQKQVSSNGKNFVVYFGREFVELPFDINLQKFTKYDYPGTTTAMSYESVVTIGKAGVTKLISMNEPLKQAGFTVYQASYVMNPGEPPMSVFSVNQDPGRLPKYIGSLILAIGIIVFTFMRSSVYRNLKKG